MEAAIRYEQVNFRMPEGMKDTLKEMARRNRRTMGSEVVFHLERALASAAAATGEGLGNRAPAAAPDNSALAGAAIHQRP